MRVCPVLVPLWGHVGLRSLHVACGAQRACRGYSSAKKQGCGREVTAVWLLQLDRATGSLVSCKGLVHSMVQSVLDPGLITMIAHCGIVVTRQRTTQLVLLL